ncbi:WxL domain-containing protein [Weissella confusa]|uniref:WxL domain-containing protein n=1 Tax=Weissella confusa TaxID=1583 RepID=UPI00280BADC8|nr:WxL domain-containing protein [Weissella confusa]
MNIMQKATKHGLSGLLLAVTVLGSVAPLAAMSTPIYADNSQQPGNSDEVSGKPALADQTVFGVPQPDYKSYEDFTKGFKSQGQALPMEKDKTVSLTQNKQLQFGSLTFRRAIDMSHDFTFTGSLNIDQPGNTLGDSLGFILAPVEPDQIDNGSSGGYLGIGKLAHPEMYGDKGFDNAFYWGADLHYNVEPWDVDPNSNPDTSFDGKTEFGDPNVMNSGSYPGKNFVMFRRTDGKGQLDNIRNLTPDAHPEILYPVQLNKHGSNEVTLTWTPDKADENKESGPISGTLTATGWGHTWTEEITTAHEMALAVNAATGGDTSNMGLTAGEFKLTVGTADVTFNGAPVSDADKAAFKQPDFGKSPKEAVVGTHITVVDSAEGLAAAKSDPLFESAYVYRAPKVAGYGYVGNGKGYQIFTVTRTPDQTFTLKYNRKSTEHVDYQFANQPGVYFNKKDDSGDDGQTYTEDTPTVPGFTPDKATVTGTYSGDHKDLVTYYPTPSLPLNAGANGVVDPTKPVTPTNGTSTKQNLNTSNGLSLDYVPDFNFGKHEIESGTTTYAADDLKTNQGDMPLFAQVTDVRTHPGNWTLDVKAGPMTNKDTQSELTGAYMTFGASDVKTTSKDNDVSNVKTNFAGQQLNFDDKTEMNVVSSTSPEQATWLTRFIKKDQTDAVTLHVPGGAAQKGDYQAVLTWTLGSKPGDNQQ